MILLRSIPRRPSRAAPVWLLISVLVKGIWEVRTPHMPMTSPSAFSGCRSLEKCLPPPRFALLNLPPRPRAEDMMSMCAS
jgi:hypothetical protein